MSNKKKVRNCSHCRKPIKSTDNDFVLVENGTEERGYYHWGCRAAARRYVYEDSDRWNLILRAGEES